MTVDFLTINAKNEACSQLNLTFSNFAEFARKVIIALEDELADAIEERDSCDDRVCDMPGDPGYLEWAERQAEAANNDVLGLQTCLWAWKQVKEGRQMPVYDLMCELPDVLTNESVKFDRREQYYITGLLKNLTTVLHYQGNVMVYVA